MDEILIALGVAFFAGSLFFYWRVWQAINSVREMNIMLFALLKIAGLTSPEASRIVERTKAALDEM